MSEDTWILGVVAAKPSEQLAAPNELTVLTDGSIGAVGFITGQKNTIGVTSTQIVPARLGVPGVGRKYVNVKNTTTVAVFVGPPGLLITNGYRLNVGENQNFELTGELDAVVAAGTGTVDFYEVF